MFKSKIKVILTIFEDVKFVQPPSWIFSIGLVYGQNFKFPLSSRMVKLKGYKWVISQIIINFFILYVKLNDLLIAIFKKHDFCPVSKNLHIS